MVLPISIQDNCVREAKAAQLTSVIGGYAALHGRRANTVNYLRKEEKSFESNLEI